MIRVAFSSIAVCLCLIAPLRAQADTMPEQIVMPHTQPVGFVTCVSGVNVACPSLAPGTPAVWRVWDQMGTAIFGFPVNVDLLNATLTFTSAAGLVGNTGVLPPPPNPFQFGRPPWAR